MADYSALRWKLRNIKPPSQYSGIEAEAVSAYKTLKNKLFSTDPNFSQAGVKDAGLRATLSQMDTQEEREFFLNKRVGQNGWTQDEFGQYALTPKGMESIGKKGGSRPTIIDEPGFSRYDIADVAGDLPAVAGAVGMGMATTGVGIPLGMSLVGLGAAGGKAVGELTEQYRGLNQQGPLEVSGDLGGEGLRAASGEGLYRGVLAPIGRKLLAPEAKRVTPEGRKLIEDAVAIGARPNVTQVTKAPILGRTQSMLNRIFGDPVAKQNSIALRRELVSLKHAAGPPTTARETGEKVAHDIGRARGALSRWSKGAYGKLDEMVEGQPIVPTQRLKNTATDIVELLPKAGDKPVFVSPETTKFISDIQGLDEFVTLSQAQMIRSQLYNSIADNTLIPGVSSHHARILYKSAKAGLDDAVTAGKMSAEAARTLKVVNSRYAKEIRKYDDAFINRIMKDKSTEGMLEPAQIVNTAFRKGGSTKLNRLMGVIKKPARDKVRRIAMEDVLSNVLKRTDDPLVEIFDGKNLLNTLDKYGPDALHEMFGKELTTRLYRFGGVTQFVTQKMAMSGGLVAAHIALHPWQNLGRLVKMNIFSRFLNTDAGFKWLTEGVEAKTTREVSAFLNRGMTQMMMLTEQHTQETQ